MKKFISIMLFPCLFPCFLQGQSLFKKSFGSGTGFSIKLLPDSGYIMAGTASKAGKNNAFLFRLKPNGDTVWTKYFSTPLNFINGERFRDVIQTSDQGFAAAGNSYFYNEDSTSTATLYTVKTNSQGDTLWTKMVDGGYNGGTGLAEDLNGNILISGHIGKFPDTVKAILIKFSPDGNMIWSNSYLADSSGAYTVFNSIIPVYDGGFILTGQMMGTGVSSIIMLRVDSAGDPLWAKSFGSSYDDNGLKIVATTDGGFAIGGITRDASAIGRIFLLRTNFLGDTIFTKGYSAVMVQDPTLNITSDGGYIMSSIATYGGKGNIFLMKSDSIGNIEWSTSYKEGFGLSILENNDGTFIFCGWANSLCIAKIDVGGYNSCFNDTVIGQQFHPGFLIKDVIIKKFIGPNLKSTNTRVFSGAYVNSCFSSVDVEEIADADRILIAPNPFSNSARVYFAGTDPKEEIKVEIFDIFCRKVKEENMYGDEISREGLSNGVYLAQFSTWGEMLGCKKLIIE